MTDTNVRLCSQGVQRVEFAGGKNELRGQEVLVVGQRDRRDAGPVARPRGLGRGPASIQINARFWYCATHEMYVVNIIKIISSTKRTAAAVCGRQVLTGAHCVYERYT